MKTIIFCLAACLLLTMFTSSCTKSDLPDMESGYHRIRIYDDTLADPRNHSIHIAAGDGRLLMTYGRTFEQMLFVNGNVTLPPPADNVWMLTDNEGILIRKDTFPSGLSVGNVVSLPDNSFLIVMYTGVPYLWGGPEWDLYMMRLDPNGVMGPVINLNPPVLHGLPFRQIWNIYLCPAHNGNVVLYFYYQGASSGTSTFVGELDTQGNFAWHRDVSDPITVTGCVPTPDGGYMVSGGLWNPALFKSDIHIMKTNSTFDSTWTRVIVADHDFMDGVKIASDGNGNYRLNYLDTYNDTTFSHILIMNDAGEIVNSASYAITPNRELYNMFTSVMVPHDASGGIFVSHTSSIGNAISSVTNQFNTTYAILDANLNITANSAFQDHTSDMLPSACRTSDGRIACFGITQMYGRRYYKPELIIID